MSSLLEPIAQQVYQNPSILDDFHVVLLHNNSPLFIDMFFRHIYQIDNIREATSSIVNGNEITYKFSDNHIEIPLTDEHIQYIKHVTRNKTISAKKSIFYIRGLPNNSSHLQNQLKNLIEKSSNAVFVIAVPSRAEVNYSLTSMAVNLSIRFPSENVIDFYRNSYKSFGHDECMSIDELTTLYSQCNGDLFNGFLRILHKIPKTKLEQALDAFVEFCDNESDYLSLITRCRDISYKLFHLNYPLSSVAKYLLGTLPSHILMDFSILAANSDHLCMTTKKDVLTYEKFFIQLAELLKVPAPKKKMLKKVVTKKIATSS